MQEALRLEPTNVINHQNLGEDYLALSRIDDAKKALDKAFALKLDGGFLRLIAYYLAFLRNDTAEMERQVAWGAGKPGDEDMLLSAQSDTEAYYGRVTKAQDFSRRAVDSAIRADSKETAAQWDVNAALREAEFGNTAEAKQALASSAALVPGAYSGDVTSTFRRDVNSHSDDVNKVGAQRRWGCNHATRFCQQSRGRLFIIISSPFLVLYMLSAPSTKESCVRMV